jgi:glutaredoxin
MKTLICKNAKYYISDDLSDRQGKTHITRYNSKPDNMPHKYFKDYIVVYGRHSCPYCQKTISLLKGKPKTLFIEIDNDDTLPIDIFAKSKLLEILKSEIGTHNTVPIVFNKGVFIGGASDVEQMRD